MKASESIGKNLKIFGSAVPVGDYHFSTKGSKYRAPGEAPQYWGILKAVYKPREAFKGFNSPWVYFLATFDPNDIAETAINRQVPYRNLEKAVAAYWDVHDRYYPEVKDIEFGCRDWSEVCENAKKSTFTLSESQLHNLIAESVKKVLKEQNTLLKNGYEVLNLVQAYQDDDSEQYIAMLKNMSEGCKKQVKEITGVTVDEMLSHWYAFHKAMIAIKKRYSELLTTGNNDGGYYDWH